MSVPFRAHLVPLFEHFVLEHIRLVSQSYISSVIMQNVELQNGCYKKTKYVKFLEKRTFLTP